MAITLTPGSHEPDPGDAEIVEMLEEVERYSNSKEEQMDLHPVSYETHYYDCERGLGATAINPESLARARSYISVGRTIIERHIS